MRHTSRETLKYTSTLCRTVQLQMCLILIGYRVSEDHPLVIAANRDEYFARPTSAAHFWTDDSNIFAGRDEEQQGTWMGVTRTGRIAAVTNWTEVSPNGVTDLSRGNLVSEFLKGEMTAKDYLETIEGDRYQGFNLILFDAEELVYYSNRTNERRTISPGIYGLSNTRLGDRWHRVTRGEQKLASRVEKAKLIDLIEMLFDPHGVEFKAEPEKHNAPCFILGENYGTRSTTAMVMSESEIAVREQSYGPQGKKLDYVEQHIKVKENELNGP